MPVGLFLITWIQFFVVVEKRRSVGQVIEPGHNKFVHVRGHVNRIRTQFQPPGAHTYPHNKLPAM